MFRKWQREVSLYKKQQQKLILRNSKMSQIKCAFSVLSMKFDTKDLLRSKFKIWHNYTIVKRNKGWNPNFVRNYSQKLTFGGKMTDLRHRESNMLDRSNNISFIDQKVHQKMTSFMKINKLITYQYI